MSTLELADLLNQEVVENPLLEEIPTEDLQAADAQPAPKRAGSAEARGQERHLGRRRLRVLLRRLPRRRLSAHARRRKSKSCRRSRTRSRPRASLTDHLEWQLSLQTDDDQVREIGEAIIGNLDDDGYLVASVDEIASMGPWPIEEVERCCA